jgi:hypothetical protein
MRLRETPSQLADSCRTAKPWGLLAERSKNWQLLAFSINSRKYIVRSAFIAERERSSLSWFLANRESLDGDFLLPRLVVVRLYTELPNLVGGRAFQV